MTNAIALPAFERTETTSEAAFRPRLLSLRLANQPKKDREPQPGELAWFWRNFKAAEMALAIDPTSQRLAGTLAVWSDAWAIMAWNSSLKEVRGDIGTLADCRRGLSPLKASNETLEYRKAYVATAEELLSSIEGK